MGRETKTLAECTRCRMQLGRIYIFKQGHAVWRAFCQIAWPILCTCCCSVDDGLMYINTRYRCLAFPVSTAVFNKRIPNVFTFFLSCHVYYDLYLFYFSNVLFFWCGYTVPVTGTKWTRLFTTCAERRNRQTDRQRRQKNQTHMYSYLITH